MTDKKVLVNGEEVAPGKKQKLYNELTKKQIEELIRKKREELKRSK